MNIKDETPGTAKTGAVICKKIIPGSHLFEYEALLFITDLPLSTTDEELKKWLEETHQQITGAGCAELLFRADINATSNEISEQFKGLNNDTNKAGIVSFKN